MGRLVAGREGRGQIDGCVGGWVVGKGVEARAGSERGGKLQHPGNERHTLSRLLHTNYTCTYHEHCLGTY